MLHHYHSLNPIESEYALQPIASQVYGYVSEVFKCVSRNDNLPYALRRIEGLHRLGAVFASDYTQQMIQMFSSIQHPNIVGLRDVFTSKAVRATPSIFFVYDYHPCALTIKQRYFSTLPTNTSNTSSSASVPPNLVPANTATPVGSGGAQTIAESVIWSYITQLVSALSTIHGARLACRSIHPSKIIITGKNRIRINGLGAIDVLEVDKGVHNSSEVIHSYQCQDIVSLGKLILCLATLNLHAMRNLAASLDYVSAYYTHDLKNFIHMTLLNAAKPAPTINDIMVMLAPRISRELEHLHNHTDALERNLARECENGRLFRLVAKLGFINERPEFEMNASWSETGDRYLLKLFRDYIFHQTSPEGTPLLDYGHVVTVLNKLDVGSPELIVLMSRDEQSMLVVSYHDLRKCLEQTYNELFMASSKVSSQSSSSLQQSSSMKLPSLQSPSIQPPSMRPHR